ncbi:hypothetical protein Tco_1533852 [Tanacetum coccineum]
MDKLLKEVLMIDELSIVETDKVNHIVEMDILKLVVEVECFGKCVDEFHKVTVLFGEMQLKQEDRSYVYASNELHLHSRSMLFIGRRVFRKLGINLKLLQWHLVDVHIIE